MTSKQVFLLILLGLIAATTAFNVNAVPRDMTLRLVSIFSIIGLSAAKFRELNVLTYNVGLVNSIGFPVFREARRDKIIEALNTSDADFVCLQEAFLGEDVKAIVDGVSRVFPYSFSKIHNKDGTVDGSPSSNIAPVCSDLTPFIPLFICAFEICITETSSAGLMNCTSTFCPEVVANVMTTSSEECIMCFLTSLPDSDGFYEGCAGLGTNPQLKKMNTQGLLMLSRKRMKRSRFVDFYRKTTEMFPRGYLKTKVSGVHTVCTHLTAIFDIYAEVNLANRFSSYEEQNMYEIRRLVRFFGNKRRIVLLGDFNVGPEGQNGSKAIAIDNYVVLNSTFDTQIVDACTYCPYPENVYNTVDDFFILDHVFTKGLDIEWINRVYTPDQSTLFFNGTQLPLSDHEGVHANIKRRT